MLVVVLAVCAASYALTQSAFSTALAQEKQKSLDRIRMLAVVVENMAAGYSFTSDQAALAGVMQFAATGDFASAALYWPDGGAVYPTSGVLDAGLLAGAKTGVSHRIVRLGNAYRMEMAMPVQLGVKTGVLALSADVSAPFALSANMLRTANLLTLAAVAASGLIMLLISYFLTRPIRTLSAAARAFAGGDFKERALVASRDEVGDLACDFNRMADSLQAHMETLETEARRREDFVASFAHELKTPLTSIIGYADMLRSRQMGEEQRFACADTIYTEGRRLERLSLKLLELMVLNRQEFPQRDLETDELQRRLEVASAGLCEKYGVTLSCALPGAAVHAEPDLLQTMLLNLIDNAIKASKTGQEVTVSGARRADGYEITVRDEGAGIAQSELNRITEAFYMVDKSRSRAQNGAGLGLALAASIAKLHGAQLRFMSEQGRGTSVCVLLPYGKEERDEA